MKILIEQRMRKIYEIVQDYIKIYEKGALSQ